ncbi:type I-E CRISPR-associated protein Cas5/CasD [Streptomyces monashensis]|uniref:Type I-E CRISPR-associated protein Cas5/CasD n=1 Tax=Streptomyces monashensis TaxID=1678012 RepID=A0A1S2QRH4_9ACTN|nr:type I-E CRISPR-associated protein Cas5/CasD [Streptomyces monashensis]OIK08221.1 type I-E CRISPR-associated protein Cas5/CasD [Streptomyces monashensis]
MTSGLLLHLSGIQFWGGPQGGTTRTSHPHPTRSGITGLLAAAQGRPRGSDLTDLEQLTHTIRIDRAGQLLLDFHTVGGGRLKHETVPTAEGGHRGNALVFRDWYLHDAAFTIALTGPEPLIHDLAHALRHPVYPPHLGRRACRPDTPVLITTTDDPYSALEDLPLHRTAPRTGDTVPVIFLNEHPPTHTTPHTRTIDDVPHPGRTFTTRRLWESTRHLPTTRCAGLGTTYLQALTSHRTTS